MNLARPFARFALALALALASTLAACGGASDSDAPETADVARHLEVTDCRGETRIVERIGLHTQDGATHHELLVDGAPYTLVAATADGLDLLEVRRAEETLALAELAPDEARILAPAGEVFVSETGAGFPEALHDAVSAEATLLLSSAVVGALAEDTGAAPGVEVRRQGLDNDNLGTCNGVTCASKDGNESCCCKQKCVRNDTTCYCTTSSQSITIGSWSGGYVGAVLR